MVKERNNGKGVIGSQNASVSILKCDNCYINGLCWLNIVRPKFFFCLIFKQVFSRLRSIISLNNSLSISSMKDHNDVWSMFLLVFLIDFVGGIGYLASLWSSSLLLGYNGPRKCYFSIMVLRVHGSFVAFIKKKHINTPTSSIRRCPL